MVFYRLLSPLMNHLISKWTAAIGEDVDINQIEPELIILFASLGLEMLK